MKEDRAMQHAWRHLLCKCGVMQLQPVHCHLLERMRLRYGSSELREGQSGGAAHVQAIHH